MTPRLVARPASRLAPDARGLVPPVNAWVSAARFARVRTGVAGLLMAAALAGCGGPDANTTSPGDSPATRLATAFPGAPSDPPSPQASRPPAPWPTARATPTVVLVPLVPVTGFWSRERAISRADLGAALAGTAGRTVYVGEGELAPLAAAVRVEPGAGVHERPPDGVRAGILDDPTALGILRAEDVTPDVRALGVDDVDLFGTERVRDLRAWPLTVEHAATPSRTRFEPSAVWTMAAGGDVMLDRDVYRLSVLEGRGADFPWDGGTARITARECCGWPGFEIVLGERTSGPGAVRELLSAADLTVVNLENPAPDDFSYHPTGLIFTMDPGLLTGLVTAGIDAVSLGNNHIGNGGASGVSDTIENLDDVGIAAFGAGPDATAARQPAWLTAGGLRVAMLGYDGVASSADATSTRAGAATLDPSAAERDIRAARAAGADVVIVVPHWGREYTDVVTPEQRALAARLVRAGADVVLGSHSHWAGPLELVGGRPVVYSMGDLVFDLEHDERTQQGVIVELTFVGPRVVQVALHPTLILDDSQPNLLELDGGGWDLLDAIARASP